MGEIFAPVELLQSLPDLLAEPCIVIDVVLDELLHVLIRAAAVFSGDTVDLRFQIGVEMYFHCLQGRRAMAELSTAPHASN